MSDLNERFKAQLAKDELAENNRQRSPDQPPAPNFIPSMPSVDALHGTNTSIAKKLNYVEIDPARCRRWQYHNRNTAWLNRPEQHSLAESIVRDGQQQLGLVRVVENDPKIDHEIIFGFRRAEACRSRNIKFKARVLPASTPDAVCVQYMHVENTESQNVSELEDAFNYRALLRDKVFATQPELAASLCVSQGYVSRLVGAAVVFDYDWLRELIEPVVMDVSIRTAHTIAKALNDPNTLRNMRNHAKRLKEQGAAVKGENLAAALLGSRSKGGKKEKVVLVKRGRRNVVQLQDDGEGNLELSIQAYERDDAQNEQLLVAINELLKARL